MILAAALFLSMACSRLGTAPAPLAPQGETARLEAVLDSAGKNRRELKKFLARYNDKPDMARAARFLVSNLPLADRAWMSAAMLSENLEYAFLARRAMDWGEKIPEDIFLHYVLPHRVSQEEAQPFRPGFFLELAPLAARAGSMEKAVLAVNRWCFSKTGFKTTSRRDQGPLTTIARGVGRCEEALILLVSALRSIGIPARQAYVPAWNHADDNHAWTEVWIEGDWRYLESANPDFGLDRAWFSPLAAHAPLVMAPTFGRITPPPPNLYRDGAGFSLLNQTARYAPTQQLRVKTIRADGSPASGAEVYVSVFNYGAFRPIARIICDQNGEGSLTAGPGAFLLSSAGPDGSDFAFSGRVEGESSDQPETVLDLGRKRAPGGTIELRFLSPGAKRPLPANQEGARSEKTLGLKQARLDRFESLAAVANDFAGLTKNTQRRKGLDKIFEQARANGPEIMRLYLTAPARIKPVLEEWLGLLDPKDLAGLATGPVLAEIRAGLDSRGLAASLGITYSDETFLNLVLNPRVLYEPLALDRTRLARVFSPMLQGLDQNSLRIGLARLNHAVSRPRLEPLTIFGPAPGPEMMLSSGRLRGPLDRSLLAASALRSVGIPARCLEEQGWVEYFNGREWSPMYPDRPGELDDKKTDPTARAYYAKRGSVRISFFREGKRLGPNEFNYYRGFTICRFTTKGYFNSLEKTLSGGFEEKEKSWNIGLPPGKYHLLAGTKPEPGLKRVRIIPFQIESGQALSLEVNLDRP